MIELVVESLFYLGLIAFLMGSIEVGYRMGARRAAQTDARAAGPVGAIQAAMLGLLGLLIAFTFSAAAARFLDRQDLIVTEANAIGTAFLRADLLPAAERHELQTALRDYAAHRLQASNSMIAGRPAEYLMDVEAMHGRIWRGAMAGVMKQPEMALPVLNPVNDVIDIHSLRLAASKKRLPSLILALLLIASIVGCGAIGFGCGLSGQRRVNLTLALSVLIGTCLWVTFDLDNPRTGLLQLSDAPLEALKLVVLPP